MDESLIINVWDMFKEYIPEKNRDSAADHYVDFLLGNDVDVKTLEGLTGYDPSLDRAIELVVEENMEEEEQEDESWDDDEDY